MVEIRMLRLAAGPAGVFLAGQVYVVEDAFGCALVASGAAEWAKPPQVEIDGAGLVETEALDPELEKAVRFQRRGRRRKGE